MTPTKKPALLLVEDDTFLAGMYVTKLTMEHFTVELATDGQAGLEKAKAMKPDLILLDVLLPKLNGFDVLKSLKANPATKSIPVILLTNLGQKSDVVEGLDLGAADYLIKAHFMPSEVVEKIKQHLAGIRRNGDN
ncbi:MAG: response regulator [Candidatus Kerfeldbacteria bacterium]|nr:response regulator [Candidatus Kerfeldbacteria bacterium]